MKKYIIILFILSAHLLSAQGEMFNPWKYKISGCTDDQSTKYNYSQSDYSSMMTNNIGSDTLYISTDIPDAILMVIGPNCAYGGPFISWISDTLAYFISDISYQFDVVAFWSNTSNIKSVIKENYYFNGIDRLRMRSADAIYELAFDPLDNYGTQISNFEGQLHHYVHMQIPWGLGYFALNIGIAANMQSYFSAYSSDINVLCTSLYTDIVKENDSYYIEYPAQIGIDQNILFQNDPEDYLKASFQVYASADIYDTVCKAGVLEGITYEDRWGNETTDWGGMVYDISTRKFWNGNLYIINKEYETARLLASPQFETCFQHHCIASSIETIGDSIAALFSLETPYNLYKAGNNDTLFFGNSPLTLWAAWNNNNPDNSIMAMLRNYGQLTEIIDFTSGQSYYEIFDSTGALAGSGTSFMVFLDNVLPGKYRVKISNPICNFFNGNGVSEIEATFNTKNADASPPSISNPVQFRNSDKRSVFWVDQADQLNMFFTAADFIDVNYDTVNMGFFEREYQSVIDDSTKVFVKEHHEQYWQEVDVINCNEDSAFGISYKSDLSSFTNVDSSALDIKISICDYSGNIAEYNISPAVLIGKCSPVVVGDASMISGVNYLTLYPNPAHSHVYVSLFSEKETTVNLRVMGINGHLMKYVPGLSLVEGNNVFNIDLQDNAGKIMNPGTYLIVIEADSQLITSKLIIY